MKRLSNVLRRSWLWLWLWPGFAGAVQIFSFLILLGGSQLVFFLEMGVSFLPVLVLFGWLDFVRIGLTWHKLHFEHNRLGYWLLHWRRWLLLSYVMILLFLSWWMVSFAFLKLPTGSKLHDQTLRIAWFNKFYVNKDMGTMRKRLLQIDPDIVGLAEVGVGEVDKLNLREAYPYIVSNPNNQRYKPTEHRSQCPPTMTVFMSKYPILPRKDIDEPQFLDAASSYLMDLQIVREDVVYNVFVCHLPTPVAHWSFARRNELFVDLAREINNLPDKRDVIVLGDFNTTPWSGAYVNFAWQVPQLVSVAQGRGLGSTFGKWPLRVHIDHIFVPRGSRVKRYVIDDKLGSDHHLIWADVFMAR